MTWSVHDSHPANAALVPWSSGTGDPSLSPPLGPDEVFHASPTGCFRLHHVSHFLLICSKHKLIYLNSSEIF